MKKKWNLLYVALSTVLLLAACGTSDNGNETNDKEVNGSATEGVTSNDDVIEEDKDEDKVEDKDEDIEVEPSEPVTETEKEDSTESTNENLLKDAIQTKSDEQNYSIDLLPTYMLTSEEPGRDSLYVKDNDSVFMRIETMDDEEGTYKYAVENTIAVLEASSGGSTPDKLAMTELPNGDAIEDADGYTVTSGATPVTGIVFKKDGMVVRLTIFDTPNSDHLEEFLLMAETIIKN